MSDANAQSIEKTSDLGKSPQATARRWKLELKLADKREATWRKRGTAVYKLYTPDEPAINSFNILWSNTETLRQSVYNSLPQPDARRRYSDEDPLGKAVGDTLTRALEFAQDTYDFDAVIKADVLSMLLPGRAVSRVRYVPDIRSTPKESGETVNGQAEEDDAQESETYEEIEWEQVICEHVQWDDFRMSQGKIWDEVSWIAFRHRLTRDDLVEKFGDEIGNKISLDAVADEDVNKAKADGDLFKTAEVWEIWNKDDKEVIFISLTYAVPCKIQDDPLKLSGFYPIPRPLYAIENNQTLVPAALYTQYEQQAKELNSISIRINKLIKGLKVRGVYDATLTELSELMKGEDNDLIPAQNVTALLERGGLEKAIWMLPIDAAAMVLKELYAQRDATKQVIYEITGIADIMRGATDARETKGAQEIKTQWGTQRLQRMQREVQRYIRDLIRLKAEIISEKFQTETLEAMTLLQYPHQAQVDQKNQQAMMQFQQQMQQYQSMMQQGPQQPGQQPPPPPQQPQPENPITWEAVVDAMRSDATRTYRVDIETDSTLSATQDNDMDGLQSLLGAMTQLMQGFAPIVQQGAMSIDVMKELMLVVCRRARMGTAVEDVINKIQQPPPAPDPEAGKAQAEQQTQQAQMQQQMQLEQMKAQLQDKQNQSEMQYKAQADQQSAQLSAQVEQHKQQVQAQQVEQQNQLEAQRAHMEAQNQAALEQMRTASDERMKVSEQQLAILLARMNNNAKIEVAEIAADTTLQTAQIADAKQASTE